MELSLGRPTACTARRIATTPARNAEAWTPNPLPLPLCVKIWDNQGRGSVGRLKIVGGP